MSNEEQSPGNLTPIILAIGIGAAAIALSQGKDEGGGNNKGIILSGGSACSVSDPTKARVHLDWQTSLPETEFLIERDGLIIESVFHGLKSWDSLFLGESFQGQTHSYKVIGRVSNAESNVKTITTAVCTGGGGGGNPIVSDVTVAWS